MEQDYDGTVYPDAEPASRFAGVPDGFARLWTPHRIAYIERGAASSDGCVFCTAPTLSDEEALIVHRGRSAYALLNLFPYNSGHLLVVPYRHIATYDEASADEVAEIGEITQTAMRVVRRTSRSDGFNIGMNQGAIAGAGIAAHLHQHVVPRWAADANFFPIIAQTKALPRLLGEVREEIAAGWPSAV
ncbi:HIT domain-containing protein [Homoserinibacter sp. GY 40078]|uniref:HIT family protein n=1 Tax=Homoserinibacter sp. GY 40078 TaxID=2603275 RepID=UPI0011C980B0|nr:HIT domain-containing protein [Homoserinibacter sp. GY 40078]TXK17516.1 HIT domain-containing protein [Homoserinibacter sp. GY 40078]